VVQCTNFNNIAAVFLAAFKPFGNYLNKSAVLRVDYLVNGIWVNVVKGIYERLVPVKNHPCAIKLNVINVV
jgi:hypothetical protein